MLAEQSPFLPGTKIQFAWDSTSLGVAQNCARRYLYAIIEGWQSKSPDTAVALAFGSLLHYGVEQYHRAQASGQAYSEAVVFALSKVRDYEEDGKRLLEKLPIDFEIQQMRQEEADDDESDGIDFRNSKIRTRYHLFRALVWYFEQYRSDALKVHILSSGDAAVEHSFRVPIGETLSCKAQLMLSGHYDKVVSLNDDLYVSDVKTTKSITRSWRASFDLSNQMTGYTLGGKIGLHQPIRGVWIDAVQLQVGGVKFNRFTTHRSESQLQEYQELLGYTARLAERWYNEQYYPLNTGFHCNMCQFREVCRQPPEFRRAYLKTYFEQKPAWNPLRNR